MHKALRAYGEVLRLVRRLPKDTRPYYAKYVRENFVNYREVDPNDANAVQELLNRTYTHSLWVLKKVTRVYETVNYELIHAIFRAIVFCLYLIARFVMICSIQWMKLRQISSRKFAAVDGQPCTQYVCFYSQKTNTSSFLKENFSPNFICMIT